MSKRPQSDLQSSRTFNIAVVGLSGTEREKGVAGVGKSCLINRFIRPNADDYYTDHISILSQSDFAGRVVNNDHFLYWGEATRTGDDAADFRFRIIEQTEFADDSSFQSFRIGKTEPYFKRCAMTRLQSAEKLAYICKNQLGLEHEFEQNLLPDGRMTIDGFLCVFDVSEVAQRPVSRQIEHVACILAQLAKTKKPVIMATTKNDEAQRTHAIEAEHLAARKDLRSTGTPIPIVETSAHDNVNVELAFMTLAHLIERGNAGTSKSRQRPVPYQEAARARREVLDVATAAYQSLIGCQVADYNTQWESARRRLQGDSDFIHYVELFGSSMAEKLFRRHVLRLREEFIRHRLNQHLRRLDAILIELLPDLPTIADRSWYAILSWLRRQEFFEQYFIAVPETASWTDPCYLESKDDRIPFDLLEVPDAENVFRNHVNLLRMEHRKMELKRQFKQLLEDNHHIGPGKSLAEVAIFFLGRECFTSLSEKEKQEIYDEHQLALRGTARREFLELLLEHAESLARFEHTQVTSDDIRDINERLQNESRFRALARMEEDRRVILLNHLGFIQRSYRECCPFRELCVDAVLEQVLSARARRPSSFNRNSQILLDAQDSRLNFVILGNGGLASQLAAEIRLQCIDHEYVLDGEPFALEYRTIDGDVSLPDNAFRTEDFRPNGCFCVYNSTSSLEYVRRSLEKTLLSDLQRDDRLAFHGLPIVLVLGHNPDVTERGLGLLREEGQALADRLQCPFVDIPSSMMIDSSRRFNEVQIDLAMHHLVDAVKHRSSAFTCPWRAGERVEPDIRVLMCLMCGDGYHIELPLAPLLNHQFHFVSTSADAVMSVTLETEFEGSGGKRKVEVTTTSYHGAAQLMSGLYHGYLLVYWAKRRASLACLRAFAAKLVSVPTLLLAATESNVNVVYENEQTSTLLTEGNAFAESRRASFLTTGANFLQQTSSYASFFRDCWERKIETELAFGVAMAGHGVLLTVPDPAVQERMRNRPPAALPTSAGSPATLGRSSTSNSGDEMSDPACLDPAGELSDQRGASSASSQPVAGRLRVASASTVTGSTADANSGEGFEDLYSEIMAHDTERLIKPASTTHRGAKTRRNVYANRYRKSFPGASNSFTSSGYFCDVSTTEDTDGSGDFNSPKLQARGLCRGPLAPLTSACGCGLIGGGEPRYQFRKSNSMKLALKEDEEGTLSTSTSLDKRSPPPTKQKPNISKKPKAFDSGKLVDLNSSISSVKAPLATPDPIDVFGDYAQVKDALDASPLVQIENNYASVADILPAGRLHRIRSTVSRQQQDTCTGDSDSDSEGSSPERELTKDPWVNRRQPAFKKKLPPQYKRVGLSVSPAGDDHQALLHSDQLEKVCDYSPSDGTDGTADDADRSVAIIPPVLKTKKKRSLRGARKTQRPSLTWTDTDANDVSAKTNTEDDGKSRGLEEISDGLANWRQRLRLRSEKEKDGREAERHSRKDDRKARNGADDDRRRSKSKSEKSAPSARKSKKDNKKRGGVSGRGNGSTLEELARSYPPDATSLVPPFVRACVEYIENEGMSAEGLYRVPGNRAHVDQLMESFKEDAKFDMNAANIPVNAAVTALKQFFSELREPVVPLSLYDDLKDAVSLPDRTARLLAVRGLLRKLPPANLDVLKYIITHLSRVAKHCADNSMDSKNLAICWWPTLMWPEITSMDTMYLITRPLEEVIQLLIDQQGFFFHGENEVN